MCTNSYRFKHTVLSALIIISGFTLFNCSNDDEKKTIDITDPDKVSEAVTIENATFISGNPPAPTLSETAPILGSDEYTILGIQGSKVIIDSYLESGSASGFYVKIDGASGYFKVNATQASGRLGLKEKKTLFGKHASGRKQEDDSQSFSIELPDNIEPGEFCLSYCVYDAQNQVSNIIERCVVVTQLGGSGSSFLTKNEWSLVKFEEFENGALIETEVVGETETYEDISSFDCEGGIVELEYTEEYRTDYVYYKFTSNGAFSGEGKFYEKFLDWENSGCEIVYNVTTEEVSVTGGWSYDDNTNTLIFIYNVEEDEGFETVVEQYDAEIIGNNLILIEDFDDDAFKVTLEPRN